MALAFAIESPLHAMLIWPMTLWLGASFTGMKFFFVVGEADGDVEVLGLGDADPDVVGVTVGVGPTVPVPVGVTEGDADGEVLGVTAPPTASPLRQT